MTERVPHIMRVVGAVALLGVGIVHIQQYAADSYSSIPTIGTLFVLNFASATAVALGLLVPVRSAVLRRMLALGGIRGEVGDLVGVHHRGGRLDLAVPHLQLHDAEDRAIGGKRHGAGPRVL